MGAIKAVFRSWDNPRAIYYRRMNDIPSSWGTAVNVQSMAYGNMGDTSGTGVAFTRNPATGEKKTVRRILMNAQGEDVVAGIRTPRPSTSCGTSCLRCMNSLPLSRKNWKTLPRHAGHGVHHRAGQALYAPDPERQSAPPPPP